MSKRIVITGATGNIGSFATERLLSLGYEVRTIVRSKTKADVLNEKGAEAIIADLDKLISSSLFENADAALLITPVGEYFQKISIDLIDAAAKANIKHIVRISIDSEFVNAKAILGQGHAAADEHLKASGIRHTILRPGGFMQNLLAMAPMIKQGIIVAPTGNGAVPFIDSRDIADCAVALLTDSVNTEGVIDISGPEALTFSDIANKISKLVDYEVKHISPIGEEAKQSFEMAGFTGWMLDAMLDDTANVARGVGSTVRQGVKHLTGNEPRTIEAFLKEHIHYFQ